MAVFKCKMCGGALEVNNETVAVCQYCGTKQTLPKLDDDRKANLYDRANHFRRNNEFDKAMGIYEQILNEDNTDAESYWSLVLCRYGIEYVEDPTTRNRIPTVNRAQFTSIFDDEDYKSAIRHADSAQKGIYESEANVINEIQKRILAISQNEEPFDVFICYKESDKNGRRTPDSVLAAELYHELVREGFKVFFSRITLEDKLGQEYEPYIFAALNSAKVMVVLGTKPEYFNAVWVKNEWSRYLALIKNGARKMLIPAYKDMDPYDLPEQFSHLQAQDMSKLGFMQDLIRGIKKVSGAVEESPVVSKTTSAPNNNISGILDRAFIHLETKEWKKANSLFEEALKINPRLSDAFLGKCMCSLHISSRDSLAKKGKRLLKNNYFKLAYKFAIEPQKNKLQVIVNTIKDNEKRKRNKIKKLTITSALIIAITLGGTLSYTKIISPMIKYNTAVELYEKGDYGNSYFAFMEIYDYKDSIQKINAISKEKLNRQIIAAAPWHTVALKQDGTVVAAGNLSSGKCKISKWKDIVSVSAGQYHTVGLKKDGTVVATCDKGSENCCEVGSWDNIIAISAGTFHTVGLKTDGTVVAVGDNGNGECNVSSWKNITAISAGSWITVGLKKDGTVISTINIPELSKWKNIIKVVTDGDFVVGFNDKGEMLAVSVYSKDTSVGQILHSTLEDLDFSKFTNLIDFVPFVGLKKDGTIVANGFNKGEYDYRTWTDIIAISTFDHIAAVKSDGTVLSTVGWNEKGQCDVFGWSNVGYYKYE